MAAGRLALAAATAERTPHGCNCTSDAAHERRRIVHFAVTAHPSAEWTAHQLREAFPWDTAPHYLLRDRDRIFGHEFVNQVKTMGIKQMLSAPRSPWQTAYIERLIGSIRRECLDHLIVFNERTLKRHLLAYAAYYHATRTHLALQNIIATSAGSPEKAFNCQRRVGLPFVDEQLTYARVNASSTLAQPQTRIPGNLRSE